MQLSPATLWSSLRAELRLVSWPVAFFAILLAGAIGWQISVPAEHWLDSTYRAVQLFGFNFDPPSANFTVSWPLQVARFAAALFTVAAFVLTLGRSVILAIKARINAARRRVLAVVIGAGSAGTGLAQALQHSDRGMRVVLIDRTVTAANRRTAGDHGIELFEVDAHDPVTMADARIGIRKAATIVVACGSDAATIAAGTTLAGMTGQPGGTAAPRIWLHLRDQRLLASMRDRQDLPAGVARHIDVFSLREAAARHLIMLLRPAVLARDLGQTRVHGVIHGFGDMGWAALEQFILNSAAPDCGTPVFTVLTPDAVAAEKRWRASHPVVDQVAVVEFVPADVMALAMTDPAQPDLALIERQAPPTFHFFACGNDEMAIAGALHMRKAMAMGARRACPVAVRSWNCGSSTSLLEVKGSDLRNRLIMIGDARMSAERSIAVERNLEKMAAHIHEDYRRRSSRPGPAYGDLPDSLRESNRRAAAHYFLKLAWLGFDQVDCTLPGYGLCRSDMAEIEAAHAQDSANFRALEHMRWCADRAIDGWTLGPRDNERRRRGQMIPYGDLTDDEKNKDKNQLDALLAFLRPMAQGVGGHGRIVEVQAAQQPAWRQDGNRLSLAFATPPDWRALQSRQAARTRFVITIPPEPPIQPGETPADRTNRRLVVYAAFVADLTRAAGPGIYFRLRRVDPTGWDWLPEQERVDGC